MSNSPFLYPSITSLPGQSGLSSTERAGKKSEGAPGEFGKVFDTEIAKGRDTPELKTPTTGLDQVGSPLKFSAHASQRLRERKIQLDQATMTKVHEAVNKAESKGVDDTLVLTKDAALIVNVPNRTVITAMDRASMNGNVFTNIDGAVII